ncbi:MAG: SpoVA/SpoVAEb family sporulation membrane protein [Synergistaceae bacterium]|jgi:hypothetical protein|nr:SpoVA/SpoVAEb family sporulation membrane protein [Synergistaceae bacterium]
MVDSKTRGYVGAFVVGGAIGMIGQVIMDIYIFLEVPYAVLFMIFTLACAGALLANIGMYQKIAAFGGMGADMPMCGLSAGIAFVIAGARAKGASPGKAVIAGMTAPAIIFGSGSVLALILAAAG